jgi:uncharacterized membrane protein YkvA (DUF1232 family)
MKTFFIALAGVVAGIYLLNPTLGIFEFIPDNLPVIGNLDEAGAMTIVIASLSYFGIDISKFFKRTEK